MSKRKYLLSLPEILGIFWIKIQGAEWAQVGFSTNYFNVIPCQPLYIDEEDENLGFHISSKYPLFSFYEDAGLNIRKESWGNITRIYCENWDKFQTWITSYLQEYQDGKLLPNGDFWGAEQNRKKMMNFLQQYKDLKGANFTLEKEILFEEKEFQLSKKVRIWEELLVLEQAGVLRLTLSQKEFTDYIEWIEWWDVDVELLQKVLKAFSKSIFYLKIMITENNEVFFDDKEVQIKNKTKEFILLKYLVEHKGEPVDREVIYKLLKYKNKIKPYHKENWDDAFDYKKHKKINIDEHKAQKLRDLIARIRRKLGKHAPKITSSKKEGVALKNPN